MPRTPQHWDLYLESGPQRKSTLVHVVGLLGCACFGPTTDEAIAAAPDEIRAYLRYLKRHGEKVDPSAPIKTRVAEHITIGDFLGHGSPQAVYAPDRDPVTAAELATYLRRLEWSRADLLALIKGTSAKVLDAKPPKGRSLRDILLHVLGADSGYLASSLGAVKTVNAPMNAAMRGDLDVRIALKEARDAAIERLRALTPAERAFVKERPSGARTMRKTIRRMLEHEWEHRREIARRLGTEA
ncbi:MAG: DinB family protein [Chloroflexota bacterium]|nr:DinB family protein [Chloroflexota bacterium]